MNCDDFVKNDYLFVCVSFQLLYCTSHLCLISVTLKRNLRLIFFAPICAEVQVLVSMCITQEVFVCVCMCVYVCVCVCVSVCHH